MAFKKRKIVESLTRKGFVEDRHTSHVFYVFTSSNGIKPGIDIHFSHGSDTDLKDEILSRMARKVSLSLADFKKLIRCPMSQQLFEEKLREQGYLE